MEYWGSLDSLELIWGGAVEVSAKRLETWENKFRFRHAIQVLEETRHQAIKFILIQPGIGERTAWNKRSMEFPDC